MPVWSHTVTVKAGGNPKQRTAEQLASVVAALSTSNDTGGFGKGAEQLGVDMIDNDVPPPRRFKDINVQKIYHKLLTLILER